MKRLRLMIVATTLLTVTGASAQEPERQPQPPQPPAQGTQVRGVRGPVTPLEVQVTISRYQGEKKISSMPYMLAVNANSTDAQLTLNVDVPVAATTFVPADDKSPPPGPLMSFNYRPVGTNIVCGASSADDGRFEITIGVDETSVVPSSEGQVGTRPGMPAFRNFKSRNRLLLRDGQTRQYTAATDRISGETVRVDVMLKVVK
ncbi:MAG TPA: hypothetical protein VKB50_31020 [Vicinamibacterales bacterium]|nr:hypothetical protein [Vicinamibacterales bacterium]